MATKIWIGTSQTNASTTSGDYSAADNWKPISLVNPTYRWVASSSGTGEYYVELAGGGDPSLLEPTNVQQLVASVKTNMAAGTAGSLAVSEWDYTDNDTLGFSTIYVRLSDGADPDSKDDGHVTSTAIPQAGDDVYLPATSTQAITAGLDQSGVAIGDFIVKKFGGEIASTAGYLIIDPDRVELDLEQEAAIDIGSANINIEVHGTVAADEGERGLYLLGSDIATLSVRDGDVGLAVQGGESSTVATVRVVGDGSSLWLGEGVSLTTFSQTGGDNVINCAATTVNNNGGDVTTEGEGAIATFNANAGSSVLNSVGTVTTVVLDGGDVDMTQSGEPRTITNRKGNRGSFLYDPSVVTLTNKDTAPDYPIIITWDAVL